MKINILTLFPEMFTAVTGSILGKAAERGILELNFINIRDYTEDKHKKVDDTPFGGGPGMVMMAQQLCIRDRVNAAAASSRIDLLTADQPAVGLVADLQRPVGSRIGRHQRPCHLGYDIDDHIKGDNGNKK